MYKTKTFDTSSAAYNVGGTKFTVTRYDTGWALDEIYSTHQLTLEDIDGSSTGTATVKIGVPGGTSLKTHATDMKVGDTIMIEGPRVNIIEVDITLGTGASTPKLMLTSATRGI
jgi:hypothetical protein